MPVKQVLRLDPDAKNFIIFRRDITSPRLELALDLDARTCCTDNPACVSGPTYETTTFGFPAAAPRLDNTGKNQAA